MQAIAGDISAHKPVYEGMCVKCQELLGHGVEDAEELQQKLDNAQQRWNAIQVCLTVCVCVTVCVCRVCVCVCVCVCVST